MTGPGPGGAIVSAQTNALEGAWTGLVQLLSMAGPMSQLGQEPTRRVVPVAAALPLKAVAPVARQRDGSGPDLPIGA
jgi:hypothetical protein